MGDCKKKLQIERMTIRFLQCKKIDYPTYEKHQSEVIAFFYIIQLGIDCGFFEAEFESVGKAVGQNRNRKKTMCEKSLEAIFIGDIACVFRCSIVSTHMTDSDSQTTVQLLYIKSIA